MPPPSVSVIIPTHDVGPYLEACLRSVLRQSLSDVEVLCVDDASTDRTVEILRDFAAGDDRITVLPLDRNVGAGTARNIGLERARGRYVAFMDGDDMYPDEHALARLHGKAVEHGVDICGGSLFTFHGNVIDRHVPLQHFTSEGPVTYRDYQYEGGFYRYMFRTNFLNRHGIRFPAYRRHQDSVFLVRAMTTAGSFHAIADPVYAYRKGHKELVWTATTSRDHFLGIQEILSLAARHDLVLLHRRMARNIGISLRRRLPHSKDAGFFETFDGVFLACLESLERGTASLPLSWADRSALRSKILAWRTRHAWWRLLARLRRRGPRSIAPAGNEVAPERDGDR